VQRLTKAAMATGGAAVLLLGGSRDAGVLDSFGNLSMTDGALAGVLRSR
jgi:hypothetical protein